MKRAPELLAPAGNFEKLRAAVLYGADAVYLAGNAFGMRAAAGNFTDEELPRAVEYAHEHGVRAYLTVNTMPRTSEYPALEFYLNFVRGCGVDALIVGDLGVFTLAHRIAPELDVHISTQASAVSLADVLAWRALGARRVVLARELSFDEVRQICAETPEDTEIECFIHGAMCISYSGRCLLSNYFTGRDANHGACAQPCRWNYRTLDVYEQQRPDDPLHLYEDAGGTFVMSSRDMCMIEHIPKLVDCGIRSFKIEGRMKSAYYTAVVTNAYRMAIDAYLRDGAAYQPISALRRELESVSHRDYSTGLWFRGADVDAGVCQNTGYIREKAYIGTALSYDAKSGFAVFMQHNKICRGESVELISPGCTGRAFRASELFDENDSPIESAPHPAMKFKLRVPFEVRAGDILRGGEESCSS